MGRRRALLGAFLVLVAVFATACEGLSCSSNQNSPSDPLGTAVAAATTTSTTLPPTTTTTLSPLDIYRAEMKAWKNKYGADMQENYNILSAMRNPLNPTDQQVTAARILADLMDGLVPDLRGIQAPPNLSSAHTEYVASLEDMHEGVDRLAQGLEHGGIGGSIDVTRALTAIYSADKDGAEARTTLEQALGFSLTSAD